MTRRTSRFLAAGAILVGVVALSPRAAEARGHVGFHIVVRGGLGGPFYGYSYGYPYCGFSPYWGPCYGYGSYEPNVSTGPQLSTAAAANVGAVDLDVKPVAAEARVDRRLATGARELDGRLGAPRLEDASPGTKPGAKAAAAH